MSSCGILLIIESKTLKWSPCEVAVVNLQLMMFAVETLVVKPACAHGSTEHNRNIYSIFEQSIQRLCRFTFSCVCIYSVLNNTRLYRNVNDIMIVSVHIDKSIDTDKNQVTKFVKIANLDYNIFYYNAM